MTQLTGFRTDRLGAFIEKDPDATLDYSMDWSDWLAQGDALATQQWRVSTISGDANPMTIGTTSLNGVTATTTAIVAGGSAGSTYTLTCKVTTDGGLTDERYFRIIVKNRSL